MGEQTLDTPIDATAAENFRAQGLRFELLKTTDEGFAPWYQAMTRGFHGPIADDDHIPLRVDGFAHRRMSALYDDSLADSRTPVATSSAWIADLTLPGGSTIPSWPISTVTVAPTHRRRGIARNLIEAELRTAVELDVPVAILTASEATIYERFGFAPAAMRADWTIDTTRAHWTGPVPGGKLQLVTSEQARDEGGLDILKRALLQSPGEMSFDGHLWMRMFGMPGRADPKQLRVVRYDDANGVQQGLAIYKVADRSDHQPATATVEYLLSATDDAYAALWRYLLELDLVGQVQADLRSVDEPLRWQISDSRAASVDHVGDHLWLRILDVERALEARTYAANGAFALELDDPLGFAGGSYLLTIGDHGRASVNRREGGPDVDGAHRLAMHVSDLSKIYLGATSVSTLVRAGRILEKSPGAAAAADAAFRSPVTPWLSTWF